MTATQTDAKKSVASGRGVATVEAVPSGLRQVVIDVGQIAQLFGRLFMGVVREPRGFWGAAFEEMYGMLRFAWIPVLLADGGFSFAIGGFAYDLLKVAGAPNRVGTFFVMAGPREIAPFTVAMAIAGVMGTSLTADLGARKVREELDALQVLGIDPERALVLPRVVAMTFMVVGFNLVGVAISIIMPGVATTMIGSTSVGGYIANFFSIMNMTDLVGTVLKSVLLGLLIGIVCATKGLNVKGGAEGVGRAVNQAVVLCFAWIWIVNFTFNTIMLGTNPDMILTR
jgi:phospholipid/cholesterol/gamma-HCH transport system permease protein